MFSPFLHSLSLSTVSFLLSLLRDTKTTLHFPPFHFFREHELLLRSIAGQFARSNTQAAEFRIHDHPRSPHFPKHSKCTKGYHTHLAVERIEIGPRSSLHPARPILESRMRRKKKERKKTEQERKKEKGKMRLRHSPSFLRRRRRAPLLAYASRAYRGIGIRERQWKKEEKRGRERR